MYIPRRGSAAVAATDARPAAAAVPTRLTIFNLDTLEPAGEIDGVGGNGAAVDPKSGHGFTSSKPVSMFDTKTMTLIKTIDVGDARSRTAFSSMRSTSASTSSVIPTKDATVIDAKDGTVLGTIDLGGVPEQGVADGKGMLYVVMQDAQGSVTAVDVEDDEGDRALSRSATRADATASRSTRRTACSSRRAPDRAIRRRSRRSR